MLGGSQFQSGDLGHFTTGADTSPVAEPQRHHQPAERSRVRRILRPHSLRPPANKACLLIALCHPTGAGHLPRAPG